MPSFKLLLTQVLSASIPVIASVGRRPQRPITAGLRRHVLTAVANQIVTITDTLPTAVDLHQIVMVVVT